MQKNYFESLFVSNHIWPSRHNPFIMATMLGAIITMEFAEEFAPFLLSFTFNTYS